MSNAREILNAITDGYLFKDILMWQGIRKPEKLTRLLQAIAYQVGHEVSYNELGQIVDLDNQTVENYITLLEQAFVVYRLSPLSRNLRKELKRKRKIYFYDNGIRNAIIGQFQPLQLRQDVGALWENWLMSERLKYLAYNGVHGNRFFWRTQDGQEIDYVEERDGQFHTWQFKWNPKQRSYVSKTFSQSYPTDDGGSVHRDNYGAFLGRAL
jgi:predicted AAA+ superfamily ATPase